MTKPIVTRESLEALLAEPAKRAEVIGRALWVLFERQVEDERKSNVTKHTNAVGFSAADAKQGSITAKTFKKRLNENRRAAAEGKELPWKCEELLTQFQIDYWMEATVHGHARITKYTRQINDAAVAKAAKGV